ncbi:uncharacterized protein M6B38_343595 [Iris pallida]|uniref:Remorin C-terminal domain-containing protein n=1 Tax=Iris pallida TaxID=29817 RepID=A0AAX6GUK8_IRIPA|nr:uncharacterized protein M6B38_343595 [Iris pallida]
MEYERIEKPFSSSQVGGFSPRRLRSMLLGVEKKRKEQEEEEKADEELKDDEFKDVNVDSSGPEPHHNVAISKIRSLEEDDGAAVLSAFEFHKAAAAAQRPPFSKPAPSKWDDAHKWLASPNSNRGTKGKMAGGGGGGHGSRTSATKVVSEDVDTKRIDRSQIKREIGEHKAAAAAAANNLVKDSCVGAYSGVKPAIAAENFVTDSAVSLSRHDSSVTVQSDTTFLRPPSTIRSVSMRDMGTEMTPLASQEPSRNGTPVGATTPIRSPSSSRPSTPQRSVPTSTLNVRGDFNEAHNGRELSEKELQMKTRREIMILGTQLGKANIAAWASKDEEEQEASTSLQNVPVNQLAKSIIQTRAASWEEAEKAKYMARFKQEEIKIQAWENHQKAETEAEIRKIEVEVERMKARAQEKLMEKVAAARHKAEEKRAAAEAKRDQQAARTTQQVEYIRNTGHIPSSFSCWGWCS